MIEGQKEHARSESRIAEARQLFPGAERWTYMDVSQRGILSTKVRAAVDDYLYERLDNGGNKKWMLDKIEQVRERYAQLINAHPVEIAYTKNVSDGLNMIAGALHWEEGDNVVVCPELEHPNNVYLLVQPPEAERCRGTCHEAPRWLHPH